MYVIPFQDDDAVGGFYDDVLLNGICARIRFLFGGGKPLTL
jgi:hypothetical protein